MIFEPNHDIFHMYPVIYLLKDGCRTARPGFATILAGTILNLGARAAALDVAAFCRRPLLSTAIEAAW